MLVALAAAANETTIHSMQSGTPHGPTTIHDHGIHGEGQIIAILDTGLDYDNCFFTEANGSAPPMNTGDPVLGLRSSAVDPARRKVIAYDFLFSCDQYPGRPGCDSPANRLAFDNQGHGTHAAGAAAGDRGTPIVHDTGDAIAPGAKLVVQDAGYVNGDACTQRPGLGCPTIDLHPVLLQAWQQGARIHSNSWGDLQGSVSNPPTGNYSKASQDIDDFVWTHPDMLVIFETGNGGGRGASSLSAPGTAKNTIDVAGTRVFGEDDDLLTDYSGIGPTRDGRLKPDLVGPALVFAGDTDGDVTTGTCDSSNQPGTSWASPTLAGAAALVRQYYAEGYYPTGVRVPGHALLPSAALLKATLIGAARPVPNRWTSAGFAVAARPVPSFEQGFGFPVLGDVLSFPGSTRKLIVRDVVAGAGLTEGASEALLVRARPGVPLKAVLVWTDPPGVVRGASDATPELVNDLDLTVIDPGGHALLGNDRLNAALPDRLNNVEVVSISAPVPGTYTIRVAAARISRGPRQNYALVITGDFDDSRPRAARH